MALGRQLYKENCANCHQEDGSGLRRLYPPLKNSDFLNNDVAEILCIIRYGQIGDITVNGITYDQEMPENRQLTDLDIAAISTYVLSAYGNKEIMISLEDISNLKSTCKEK